MPPTIAMVIPISGQRLPSAWDATDAFIFAVLFGAARAFSSPVG